MMKKIILLIFGLFLFLPSFSHAVVNVKGYYRSNGTYVAPHVRSNPNGLKSDNYSYTGGNAYNPSYYTSTTPGWQTPTTITDPYYYAGLSAYNSNTTVPDYMTLGYGSSSYTPSSYSSTSAYKKVTGGYSSYGILFCDSGYYDGGSSCIKAPSNATANGYSFSCNNGYKKSGNSCVLAVENSVYVNGSWYCNTGTYLNNDQTKCITPEASCIESNGEGWHSVGNTCYSCNNGYIFNPSDMKCYSPETSLTKANGCLKSGGGFSIYTGLKCI